MSHDDLIELLESAERGLKDLRAAEYLIIGDYDPRRTSEEPSFLFPLVPLEDACDS